MSIDVFSQDLTVISYGRRASDGKVLIQYVINRVGFYYNIRFASRAYSPGNEYGFPMTPAVDDPEHDSDPLIVSTAGNKFTWVWDAPADGYPAINLSGWTIFLSYMNLYCCTLGDSVTRLPESTGSTGAVGTAAAAATSPVASPTAPSSSGSAPAPDSAPFGPVAGAAPPAVPSGGYAAAKPGTFGYIAGANPLSPFTVATITPTTPSTTTPTTGVATQEPLPEATVSPSLYTRTYAEILVDLTLFLVPGTGFPKDSVPMLFVFASPKVGTWLAGSKIYVEAMDSSGARYQFPSPADFEELTYNHTYGRGVCLHLNQFKVGAIKIAVAFITHQGHTIYSKVIDAEILSPGALPTPSKQNQTFTPKILNVTGFSAFMSPTFEGSYNAVGDEDLFLVTAVPNTSVVVKMTREAGETGFQPKLVISHISDLHTQLVATTDRLVGTSEEDASSHIVGWKDTAGLLTTGQTYTIRVIHKYPYYSSKWGFKIYTNATVAPVTTDFTIDGDGKLEGSLTSAYGRQSLKIVNERTHAFIYVRTGPDGGTSDIQGATSTGDTLAVVTGDKLRIYRPGMAAIYRYSDLIKEVTV